MSVVVVYSRQSLEYHAIQPRSAQHILTADAACAQGMWSVNALLLTCCTGQYWRKEPYGQNYHLCTDPFNAIGLDSLKQSKNCNYDCTSIQYAVDTVSFISQRCQHLWYQHLWLQAREQMLLLEVWQGRCHFRPEILNQSRSSYGTSFGFCSSTTSLSVIVPM